MARLLDLFFPAWNRTRLSGLVDRIAARSQNAVYARVKDRMGTMNVHQARGYIRARATAIIEREMGIAMSEIVTLAPAQREAVLADARNRVVRRLLLENMRTNQSQVRPARRQAA